MIGDGWTTIVLDTPYNYDGISNLILVADDNSGDWTNSPHMSCRVFDAISQAIRIYSDNTDYDPSAPTSYTGTIMDEKNQLLLTLGSSNMFEITATANPTAGGTVSGIGQYYENAECTLTATANEGYTFVNWTSNGIQVSTNPTYSFTVTGDAAYIANFSLNSYEVMAVPVPVEGGSVVIVGGLQEEVLVYDFEDGTAQGWTILQGPDGDSPNSWMHCTDYAGYDYSTGHGHGSDGFMLSESYIFANADDAGTPVHPDNYLVSPRVRLGGSISFWASNGDNGFGAEHFAVAVSTSGNTEVSDFTTVQEWTLSARRTGGTRTINDGIWYEFTVDLSAYIGMGYVAIHHFGCYEQWLLSVDDITIVEGDEGIHTAIFSHGESCTLTADAAEGYTFTNWTENGAMVSTEATYSFTVEDSRTLVANFSLNSYEVMAVPVPVEGGSVVIVGGLQEEVLVYDFEDGTAQGWTILQGPDGDSPNSWMHCTDYAGYDYSTGHGHGSDGFMLSESYIFANADDAGTPVHPDNYLVSPRVRLGGSISFWASNGDNGFGAEHFAVAVSTSGNTEVSDFTTFQEWTLSARRTGGTRTIDDDTWYEYTVDLSAFMGFGYVAIRHFDCYEQWLLCVDDITIVEGEPFIGVGTFGHGESCTVTATANEGYVFVNWTESGEEVSTEAAYSFVVTGERDLVANFEEQSPVVEETVELSSGLNWWSTNLDITLAQLKSAIAAAVGSNGTATIKSQDGSVNYEGGRWRGNMDFDIRKMYKIQVSADCEIMLSGIPVNPSEYEITISNGSNWIGFLSGESMSVTAAFAGLNPVEGDVVKSKTASTTYNGSSWRGSLRTLEPGHGYIYESKASGNKTFIYGMNNNK